MKTILWIALLFHGVSTCLNGVVSIYNANTEKQRCNVQGDYSVGLGLHKDKRSPCALIICYEDFHSDVFSCGTRELFLPGYKYGGFINATADYPQCCEREIVRA